MTDRAATEPGLPAVHVVQLRDIVARWGIGPDELFSGLGIDLERLEEPLASVPISTFERIAERASALTGEPALGVYLGLQMRASAHGYLGFAAMTSSTIREALDLAQRFAPIRTSAIALRLHVERGTCALVIDECVPLGAARELIVLALVVGLEHIGNALTGKVLEGVADVTFARPASFGRFEAIGVGRIRFDQPLNQLVFSDSVLDLPIVHADPGARRLAQEQCERELAALGRPPLPGLVARVRALVARSEGGFHSLDDVAVLVGMSPRTLKRRLADHDMVFSKLLEEEQRERALMLLRADVLSLEEIAARVGYSDVANFTRAFRRWTGSTPAALRRRAPSDG